MSVINSILINDLLNNKSKINSLDFSYQKLSFKNIDDICSSLSMNTQVNTLILNGTGMQDASAYRIAQLLRVNPHLKRVELARNKLLSDTCIHTILDEFKSRFYVKGSLLLLNPHRNMKNVINISNINANFVLKDSNYFAAPFVVKNANIFTSQQVTPDYLVNNYGQVEVSIVEQDMELEADHFLSRIKSSTMKMHEAALKMNTEPKSTNVKRIYMSRTSLNIFPKLENNIAMPDFCDLIEKTSLERMIWFGFREVDTPLHYDSADNIYIQIYGKKWFVLYAPTDSKYLFQHHPKPNVLSRINFSKIKNIDIVDDKTELLQHAVPYFVELNPGDILYVPKNWWHDVRSPNSPSISLSNFFINDENSIAEIENIFFREILSKQDSLESGILKCVQTAIKLNVPNYTISKVKLTLLQLSVIFNSMPSIRLLLNHKLIQLNTTGTTLPEFSPLFMAIKFGLIEIVNLLVKHMNIRLDDFELGLGYTPLTLALEEKHSIIIDFIENHKCDCDS